MGLFKRRDRASSETPNGPPTDPSSPAASTKGRQQTQDSGGGVGALMSALGMDYRSDYVKRTACPSCGAPKRLPSPSAYVYCDYCGALADFDFRRACADGGSTLPGPAYARLVNGLQPELTAARQAGDRESYRSAQHRIFDAYVAACPRALSHRVIDPVYRAQLVDFMADSSVATDFDPEFSALEQEMTASISSLEWTGSLMGRRTGGPSFRGLAGSQSPCGQCGGSLSFPVGVSQLQCPYCQTATERVGWM